MTRTCDNCQKTIPLGKDHVEVRFIGIKDMQRLFKTTELDFCSLLCLVEFWSKRRILNDWVG